MSPLVPPVPVPVTTTGPEINRHFVIDDGDGHRLRDGGVRAPTPDIIAVTAVTYYGGMQFDVDESDLPDGIDYALWSKAVKPASRDGFEDTLDFVDLLDD